MIVYKKHSLKELTTWRVGGTCDTFFCPSCSSEAALALRMLKDEGRDFFVLGGGSNVLISDGELGMSVICTKEMKSFSSEFDTAERKVILHMDSGFPVQKLLEFAVKNNLGGVEFLSGIPGTVGGALWGNAGAQGESLLSFIESAETLEQDGTLKVWRKEDLTCEYRTCPWNLSQSIMVTRCAIALIESDRESVLKRLSSFAALKRSQPLGSLTAGCVFKNPKEKSAGRLLEEAGCKGLSFGGAAVSQLHANFIENVNDASAFDIFSLSKICKERVFLRHGVELEYEIRFFGNLEKKI